MPTSTPDIRLFVQLGALVGDLVVWLIVVGLGVGLVIAFGIILVSGLGVGLGGGLFAWLVYLNTGLDRETANVLGSVLGVGLVYKLSAGLAAGLSGAEITTKTRPNEGIHRPARMAMISGLGSGVGGLALWASPGAEPWGACWAGRRARHRAQIRGTGLSPASGAPSEPPALRPHPQTLRRFPRLRG